MEPSCLDCCHQTGLNRDVAPFAVARQKSEPQTLPPPPPPPAGQFNLVLSEEIINARLYSGWSVRKSVLATNR